MEKGINEAGFMRKTRANKKPMIRPEENNSAYKIVQRLMVPKEKSPTCLTLTWMNGVFYFLTNAPKSYLCIHPRNQLADLYVSLLLRK